MPLVDITEDVFAGVRLDQAEWRRASALRIAHAKQQWTRVEKLSVWRVIRTERGDGWTWHTIDQGLTLDQAMTRVQTCSEQNKSCVYLVAPMAPLVRTLLSV